MKKEIERPLGQDKRPRRRRTPSGFSASGILLAVAGLVVLGASGAVALRERPFRTPPRAVVSAPQPAEQSSRGQDVASSNAKAAEQQDISTRVQPAKTGPAIIKVNPPAPATTKDGIVVRSPSELAQSQSFSHLPDRALIEESEMGPLPVRGSDGRRPFDAYARPWSGTRGARIAIVIGGLGLSQTGTQAAIKQLPPQITLAFAPQGNSLDRWMQSARRAGHEIVMQVPLEPYDFPNVNPGRNTLTVAASPSQNLHELRWALSRITNYTGIMNYMGGRFTADSDSVELVMEELAKRGLMYLDDGTSARSITEQAAEKNGVPFAQGDTVIDDTRDRGAILEQLDGLERTARAQGSAVGTGSAFDVTVETIKDWANEVQKRGIEIVPISALADDPEHKEIANGK